MQIAIDISEDDYRKVQDGRASVVMMRNAIRNGAPLPKTGHWIYICNSEVNGLKIVKCSECGKRTYGSGKYCPNCGAKMKEGD